ncbi:MAG: hypothetical protein AB1756_00005 [Acidobacteriota bacterium]
MQRFLTVLVLLMAGSIPLAKADDPHPARWNTAANSNWRIYASATG